MADQEAGEVDFRRLHSRALVFTIPIYAAFSLNAAIWARVGAHSAPPPNGLQPTCRRTPAPAPTVHRPLSVHGPTGASRANSMPRLTAGDAAGRPLQRQHRLRRGASQGLARREIWGYYGNDDGDADGDARTDPLGPWCDLGWGSSSPPTAAGSSRSRIFKVAMTINGDGSTC